MQDSQFAFRNRVLSQYDDDVVMPAAGTVPSTFLCGLGHQLRLSRFGPLPTHLRSYPDVGPYESRDKMKREIQST
jgi:hypothetical protein